MENKDKGILKTLKGQVVEILDKPNAQGRIYTTQLVQDKILNDISVKEQLATHSLFGEFEPDYSSYCVHTEKMSHAVSNLYIEDGKLKADIDILDTPEGKVVISYLNKGTAVYPFLYGNGELIPTEDGDVVTNYGFNYVALTRFKNINDEEE